MYGSNLQISIRSKNVVRRIQFASRRGKAEMKGNLLASLRQPISQDVTLCVPDLASNISVYKLGLLFVFPHTGGRASGNVSVHWLISFVMVVTIAVPLELYRDKLFQGRGFPWRDT
jgi:hypothetical protein